MTAPHLMRRWCTVSAVFVLTWLAVAGALTLSNPQSVSSPSSSVQDRPRSGESITQIGPSSHTRTRGRTMAAPKSNSPQEFELLKELRKAPDNGLLQHDIPSSLTVFQEQEINVRLSRGPAAEAFIQTLTDKSGEIVLVRDFVSLSLYGGKNFDIERLSPDPQSMRQNNYGLWKFHVTPKRGGKHPLEIQVNLYDGSGYVPVASYSREVEVNVPFPSRLSLMWEDYRGDWLLTYLMLPLAASIFSAWMTAKMTVQLEAKQSKLGKASSKPSRSIKRKAEPGSAPKRTRGRGAQPKSHELIGD